MGRRKMTGLVGIPELLFSRNSKKFIIDTHVSIEIGHFVELSPINTLSWFSGKISASHALAPGSVMITKILPPET